MLSLKKKKAGGERGIASVGEDVEKGEPLYTVVQLYIGTATVENSMELPPKN